MVEGKQQHAEVFPERWSKSIQRRDSIRLLIGHNIIEQIIKCFEFVVAKKLGIFKRLAIKDFQESYIIKSECIAQE